MGHVSDIEWLHSHSYVNSNANKHVNHAVNIKRLNLEPVEPFLARVNRFQLVASHIVRFYRIRLAEQACLDFELTLIS